MPSPNPPEREAIEFDAVVVATSAPVAAKLWSSVARTFDRTGQHRICRLGDCRAWFQRDQISTPLDSFGFVVPAIEKRKILSASFSSVKFPGRAPDGKVLIRVFLGGALQAELLGTVGRYQLRQIAEEELRDLLGITGEPCLSLVFRWRASMPQYHLGHLERLKPHQRLLDQLPGLALAGNAYEGVGIPQCIRSGEQAAEAMSDDPKSE